VRSSTELRGSGGWAGAQDGIVMRGGDGLAGLDDEEIAASPLAGKEALDERGIALEFVEAPAERMCAGACMGAKAFVVAETEINVGGVGVFFYPGLL